MAEDSSTCAQCGAPVSPRSRFCGSCGHAVVSPDRKTEPGALRPTPGRIGRTMLGLPAQPMAGAGGKPGAVSAASPEPSASTAPSGAAAGSAEAAKPNIARTMLGVSPAGPSGAAGPAREDATSGGPKRTILDLPPGGDPLASTRQGVAPESNAQPAPASTHKGVAPDSNARPRAALGGTMLGLPNVAPPEAGPGVQAGGGAAPSSERSPSLAHTIVDMASSPLPDAPQTGGEMGGEMGGKISGGRTMLGVGLQGAPAPRPAPAAPIAQRPAAFSDPDVPPAGVGRGLPGWSIAVGVVVLLGLLGAVYFYFGQRSSGVLASVARTDEGEVMQFEVPGAPEGSKLRFGGQERTLEAGRASFPLAADSLRVGGNAVLVELVSPGGEIESARILLEVDYRVTVDRAPLRAGEPAIDVVVSARPDSKVWLDGKPVELDDNGRAVRRDALDLAQPAAAGVIEHTVSYRIEPPEGEPSVGELSTRIPMTMMQIDKPGMSLITDRAVVDIAGAVAGAASVTIDGKPVEVRDGRFLHRFPLPAPGQYQPKVVAVVEGKAPNVAELDLRRVQDLAKAAQGFNADASLTYAKIAQNPAIYRGQKVAFDARIYNIKVEGGRTVLQALVRECPKGQACSLWVTYPAATELTKQSWVRVLGTLAGEQQFRSEQDKVQSVPKVEAAFLLPTSL